MGTLGQTLGALIRPTRAGKRVLAGITPERAEDLSFLAQLAETGLHHPLIDSTFPFERIAEAHARVDTGRKRGNVVVTLG